MAQDTAHRRFRFYGRSLLLTSERSTGKGMMGVPWYAGKEWQKRKDAIALRIRKQVARAQDRKKAREVMRKRGLIT